MPEENQVSRPKRVTSHAIGTVFADVLESGEVKFAAMIYLRKGWSSIRVPMGKSLKGDRQESLSETQVREAVQEAADDAMEFAYELLWRRLVYFETVKDDQNPEEELHLKAFFAAKVTAGKLRAHALVEHEGTDHEEHLGPMRWVEAWELIDRMSKKGATVPAHAKAVCATLMALAEYPAVAERYADLIEEIKTRQPRLATQYGDAVYAYVKALQGK